MIQSPRSILRQRPRAGLPRALLAASWIWPAGDYAPLRNVVAEFARDVTLDANALKGARLHVTADATYALWINGRHVGRGPARGWQRSWPFDSYDVARLLRPGVNRIAARVYTPGRDTFRYVHANAAGLLLALADADGELLLKTDGAWRSRIAPGRSRVTPQLSIQLEDQEHVDLRQSDAGWLAPDAPLADAKGLPAAGSIDAAGTLGRELRWSPPRQVRAFGSPPWHALEPRGLPALTGELRRYATLTARASGAADDLAWEPVDEHRAAVRLGPTRAGQISAAIVDLGEPTIGTLCLDLDGGTPGAALEVTMFEALAADGGPLLPDPLAEGRVSMRLNLLLAGGGSNFESMHAYGHRYLMLSLRGPSDEVTIRPRVRETLYPIGDAGVFECDDASLDAIRRVCARTQRVAATDAYIDAWREQAQWWGDARVQFANHNALDCDDRLFRRGIAQISSQRLPNGLTYGHAPTGAHTCVLPDFSLKWLLSLADHWWHGGTTQLVEQYRPEVRQTLAYFDGQGRGETGLLRYDERYWLFLDWADIPKAGAPTLLNLWHVHALDRLADAYAAADDSLSAELRERADAARALVQERLVDAESGLWRDGLDADGRPRDTFGTHAQALSVLAGFKPTAAIRGAIERALSPEADGDPREPSPFWITHVFDAARLLGMGGLAVDCIRRRWEPMVRQGSTFEVWRPTPQESRSHAWSAHPLFHLPRLVGGLVQTEPGWRRVTVAPRPIAGVSCCRIVQPTPRGAIRLSWDADAVRLDLPDGVEADIRLPNDVAKRGVRGTYRSRVQTSAPPHDEPAPAVQP